MRIKKIKNGMKLLKPPKASAIAQASLNTYSGVNSYIYRVCIQNRYSDRQK
jgi:hypothetical protein